MPDKSPRPSDAPIINEAADRELGRIILRHGAVTFVLLITATFALAPINFPTHPLYSIRRWLDTLSILVVMLPFFVGIQRLFAARLRIGRERVEKRAWREAIGALDPFAGPTQRFLDSTGEAHYLLSLAYTGAGEKEKAEATRAFLRKHRPGRWADKLISPGKPAAIPGAPRPRPGKAKRRF